MITLESTLTRRELEAVALLLSRMSFDDFLKLTNGDGNENQAYFFSDAAAKLRNEISEAFDHEL